jgi:hypothetical protein
MYVVFIRSRLGSKNICDHPNKKTQNAPKIPPKGPFLTFCMVDCKSPDRKVEKLGFENLIPIRAQVLLPLHIK